MNALTDSLAPWAKSHIRIAQWHLRGQPLPPPHYVKRRALRKAAQTYGCRDLVETGTFQGEMIAAVRADFDRIFSVELNDALYRRAVDRFHTDPKIRLFQGDSGEIIPNIVPLLAHRTLFWLDAHYSGSVQDGQGTLETGGADQENPVFRELEAIFQPDHLTHVVLIDDARLFNGEDGWPRLSDLSTFTHKHTSRHDLTVSYSADIIRIVPR